MFTDVSHSESDEIFVELVGELAYAWLPTAIMAVTFVCVTSYICYWSPSSLLAAATATGALLSLAKIVLMKRHRAALIGGSWDRDRARRWERAHAVLTIGFAANVGLVAGRTFLGADAGAQMIATGMLFGYCSGLVTRVAFRPRISKLAVGVAATPASLAAFWQATPPSIVLAVIFAAFAFGSMETINYLYRNSERQISLRLDMAKLARIDPLTGLFNRLGLRESFQRATDRPGNLVAVYCLDLDGFKLVNDLHGHPTGDQLLISIARRLRGVLGRSVIIARIGGDEFVVVGRDLDDREQADAFAHRLVRAVTAPFQIDRLTVQVGVSVGYALSPPTTRELDGLIAAADRALYRVKKSGGGIAAAA